MFSSDLYSKWNLYILRSSFQIFSNSWISIQFFTIGSHFLPKVLIISFVFLNILMIINCQNPWCFDGGDIWISCSFPVVSPLVWGHWVQFLDISGDEWLTSRPCAQGILAECALFLLSWRTWLPSHSQSPPRPHLPLEWSKPAFQAGRFPALMSSSTPENVCSLVDHSGNTAPSSILLSPELWQFQQFCLPLHTTVSNFGAWFLCF
jgi:hypothetical protein